MTHTRKNGSPYEEWFILIGTPHTCDTHKEEWFTLLGAPPTCDAHKEDWFILPYNKHYWVHTYSNILALVACF